MASQEQIVAEWANTSGSGYVALVYDDVTLDVTNIAYQNQRNRGRLIQVYRLPQNTLSNEFSIAPNTDRTVIPAPNNLKFAQNSEALELDRWRIQTRDA